MQWIAWSVIECRVFHSLWCNGSQLCAVESMQWGQMHLDWMQWILYSMAQTSRLNAVDSMQCDWMQWSPCREAQCIPIECRGFHAAWLNAVYSMQRGEMHPDWTQCIPCSVAKMIPIECSGYYAAWCNGFWLNAVDSMHRGAIDPNWMQWNWCKVIECSVFHAAW